jgi:hypothetical protein
MTDETIAAPVAVDFTRLKIAGAFFGGMAIAFTLVFAFPKESGLYVDRVYDQCEREFSAYADGAVGKCYVNSMTRYIAERLEKSREKLNSAYQRAR